MVRKAGRALKISQRVLPDRSKYATYILGASFERLRQLSPPPRDAPCSRDRMSKITSETKYCATNLRVINQAPVIMDRELCSQNRLGGADTVQTPGRHATPGTGKGPKPWRRASYEA